MTRQLARRQRRERALGVVLAVLGVAVGVIAAFALSNPNGHGSAAAHRAAETVTSSARAVTSPTRQATSSSAHPVTSSSSPASPSSPAASTTTTSPRLALVVLNNTATAGLAEQARARFEAGGWVVSGTGNLAADILSTCAYYDPDVPGAQASARALQAQFPTIKRVVPKFAQLPSGPVVVVLTTDYSS